VNVIAKQPAERGASARIPCPYCHGADVVEGPYVEVGALHVLREYWCEACHRTFTARTRAAVSGDS